MKMKKQVLSILGIGAMTFAIYGIAEATPIVSYEVAAGTQGNQYYTGNLGMDFDVLQDITITSLGVFDSGSDGLNRTLGVRLFDLTDTTNFLAELIFETGQTGTLIGGSRFLELTTPITLEAGFHGSIVAYGYGSGELNGNWNGGWTTNDGDGLISFVGSGRCGYGFFPTSIDGGLANRYAAGTFIYDVAPVPEPATMLLFGTGLAGVVGSRIRRKKK